MYCIRKHSNKSVLNNSVAKRAQTQSNSLRCKTNQYRFNLYLSSFFELKIVLRAIFDIFREQY